MAVDYIAAGHRNVTPYLIVPGVERVIDFIKQVFDAKPKGEVMRRPDGAVMHAEVTIGDSLVMLGEPMGDFQPMPAALYVYVRDTDAAYNRALAAGATSLMEPADQFYGDRNAGVKDSSGNVWWIGTHQEDVAPEEMKRRAEAVFRQRHAGK